MNHAVHGALSAAELTRLGDRFPLGVADFAVNTNPYGPAPVIREAMEQAAVDRYPDQTAIGLREHWADALGLCPQEIVFGSGAAELIWATCRAYLGPARALLALGPTFSAAIDCANAMGAPHASLDLFGEGEGLGHGLLPVARVEELVHGSSVPVSLVYLCSPNNPTGALWSEAEIRALEEAIHPARLLLDRSFETLRQDYPRRVGGEGLAPRTLFGIEPRPTRIEIRSFTKDFALPGVRIGAAFGTAKEVARCQRQLSPWSVSAPATMAAHALLGPEAIAHFEDCRARWWIDANRTFEGVAALGLRVLPSIVPFALVAVGDGSEVRTSLLKGGVHVRDCASFGLPSFIRVAGRPEEDRERLLAGLAALRGRHSSSAPRSPYSGSLRWPADR